MLRYILISFFSGLIFAVLDGLINGNPYARKLMICYQPIAKSAINIPLGFIIDILFGFAMCGIFILIYNSLPGEKGVVKGVLYGLMMWFFRVVMSVISTYMTLKVPGKALIYLLISGLFEMMIIGLFYGIMIAP